MKHLFTRLQKLEKARNTVPPGVVIIQTADGYLFRGVVYADLDSIPGQAAGGVVFLDYQESII
jgi:hypothetical protein